jgi:tellurite resistance protein TerA
MELIKGQKINITDIIGASNKIKIDVELNSNQVINFYAIGINNNSKIVSTSYILFSGSNQSPCAGMDLSSNVDNRVSLFIDFQKLSQNINRIKFYGSCFENNQLNSINDGLLKINENGNLKASYKFNGKDFSSNKSLLFYELYLRDNKWKLGLTLESTSDDIVHIIKQSIDTIDNSLLDKLKPKNLNLPQKIQLSKIVLSKKSDTHNFNLEKGNKNSLTVKAIWYDNGDDNDDNDDLDLRVGILLPNGMMRFINAPDFSGNYLHPPYVEHKGDVTTASGSEPPSETINVNPNISNEIGGKVALVFSVYSAVSNGVVSISSLRPFMRITYGDQKIETNLKISDTPENVYTYVLGTIIINGDQVSIQPSGIFSEPGSEATPWLDWYKDTIKIQMDGPDYFKGSFSDNKGGRGQRYIYK